MSAKTVIYDGQKTTINEEKVRDWVKRKPTFDLQDVPGIGPAAEQALIRHGVDNTPALLGQFLILRRNGMSPEEHCNAMARYLKKVGINAHRADIIYCCSEWVGKEIPAMAAAAVEADNAAENEKRDQAAKLRAFYKQHLNGATLKEQLGKVDMLVEKYSEQGFGKMWKLLRNKYEGHRPGPVPTPPVPAPLVKPKNSSFTGLIFAGLLVLVIAYMMSGQKALPAPE